GSDGASMVVGSFGSEVDGANGEMRLCLNGVESFVARSDESWMEIEI
ncbi:hypothetical protein Tco_1033906, partial [Tanacetum coccineum]